jgi:PleD family two-component response regulator
MLAHRVRLAFGGGNWHLLGISDQVTASFGVAQWSRSDHALADALTRADAALYLAKGAGRNQVYLESRRPYEAPDLRVAQSA